MNCSCYYHQSSQVNVYDCSKINMTSIPRNAPREINWILMQNNNLPELCTDLALNEDVSFLNLSSNNVEEVCPIFTHSLAKHKNLVHLDLQDNNLKYLPQSIENVKHLTRVWLSGNAFICDCSMIWMIEWIANFTTSSGENVIQQYKNITCTNDVMAGKPIYLLNRVDMECFSKGMPSWGIGLLVTGLLVFTIAAFIIIIYIYKKRKEIKLRLLQDKDENVEDKEFDVLISYRYFLIIFQSYHCNK